jgi:hypothetical protein
MASLNGEVLLGIVEEFDSSDINKSKAGEILTLDDANSLPGATSPGTINFG